ncbi:cytochrome P450 [Nocardia sp. AG03]|uniref:cytochrome P450 n=1 Tax=Nocardia sp. AG03 TaxID=3025312 RepID=UPI00241831BE|nr:cytochrome P450 [Nocardia sp. AG03]
MTAQRTTRPRWALLHALAAGRDFEGYLRRRAATGDPFAVGFPGFPPVLFTGTPEGARELFRAPIPLVTPPRPNPIEPMVGAASLILSSGERHRVDRAMLAPALHGPRVRVLGETIRDTTVDALETACGPGISGPIDALALARAITRRVILTAVFGSADQRDHEYADAVTDFLDSFTTPLLVAPALRRGLGGVGPWDRFAAARARLDRLLLADIARRRAAGPADGDLLDLLLATRYADGTTLTDPELCEQLRTLVVAGHETTATTLTWALYHLHREPGLLARTTADLADRDPLDGGDLLDAVCQETLRLHPPVPIVLRTLTGPWRWRGRDLAAGQTIGLAVGVLHSHPAIWPAPRLFHPDRFLDRAIVPFAFAPFGGGHRRCIGASLADYELRIVLATLLTTVRLRLSPALTSGARPRSVPRNLASAPDRAIQFTPAW